MPGLQVQCAAPHTSFTFYPACYCDNLQNITLHVCSCHSVLAGCPHLSQHSICAGSHALPAMIYRTGTAVTRTAMQSSLAQSVSMSTLIAPLLNSNFLTCFAAACTTVVCLLTAYTCLYSHHVRDQTMQYIGSLQHSSCSLIGMMQLLPKLNQQVQCWEKQQVMGTVAVQKSWPGRALSHPLEFQRLQTPQVLLALLFTEQQEVLLSLSSSIVQQQSQGIVLLFLTALCT